LKQKSGAASLTSSSVFRGKSIPKAGERRRERTEEHDEKTKISKEDSHEIEIRSKKVD